MLYSESKLKGYAIQAQDGQIGKLDEIYFDDGAWWVRYLVVNVGNWLKRQQVLLIPEVFSGINTENQTIEATLTKREVEKSPDALEVTPVSREKEIALHSHYDWTPYWSVDPVATTGYGRVPNTLVRTGSDVKATLDIATDANTIAVSPVREGARDEKDVVLEPVAPFELHPSGRLGNSRDLKGFRIHARDGEIGHVDDLLVDSGFGSINYLVVDTGNWLPGKKIVVPPTFAYGIAWDDSKVHLSLSKDQVMNAPIYEGESEPLISSELEARLQAFYGRTTF